MPLHTQLGEQLKHHIEEGIWRPGAQLPVVRHLAGSLGINYNTVRAVYRDLARSGFGLKHSHHGRLARLFKMLDQIIDACR